MSQGPTVGVEEEFLLINRASAHVFAVGGVVLRAAEDGADVSAELQREQMETGPRPCRDLDDLGREVRRSRRQLIEVALTLGVDMGSLTTSLHGLRTADAADRCAG